MRERLGDCSRGLPQRFASNHGTIEAPKKLTALSGPKELTAPKEERLTIFDWDDTLCSTWWVTRVMSRELNHVRLDEPVPDMKLETILKTRKDLASKNSKFRSRLQAHSSAVESLLRVARSLGRVHIVTLGSQPWFEHSAVFFAGLDVPALLRELDIEVFFAVVPSRIPEGMSVKLAAKRLVMAEAIVKTYGVGLARWDVLSVGDQPEEADALKLCCQDCPHRSRRRPLCKTLTLPVEPSLEDLSANLVRLSQELPRLVAHDRDADWTLKSALG